MKISPLAGFAGGVVSVLAVVAAALAALVFSAPSNAAVADDLAGRFDVEVVWFGESSPCGEASERGGCWQRVTPDVIYVQSGFDADTTRSIILHEIGHVVQYRLGIPMDECQADLFAISLGATWTGYDC